MINIGKTNVANDSSYRYKMSPLKTKVEGRGKNIRTILENIVEVSEQLRTQPQYTTKFFGNVLGAKTRFIPARQVGELRGEWSKQKGHDLQNILQIFVENFILCPNQRCNYPEIEFTNANKKKLRLDIHCNACGHDGYLGGKRGFGDQKGCDQLLKYIIKDYLAAEKGTKGKGKKGKGKRVDTKSRDGTSVKKKGKKTQEEIDAEDDAAIANSNIRSGGMGIVNKTNNMWVTDAGWLVDFRAKEDQKLQEMRKAMEEHKAALKLAATKGKPKSDTAAAVLRAFITKGRPVQDIVAEVRRLELAKGLDATARFKTITAAIFDFSDWRTIVPTIEKHADLLAEFTTEPPIDESEHSDAPRYKDAKIFIGVIEEIIARRLPSDMVRRSYQVFHALYDMRILDEDVILAWADDLPENSWIVDKDDAAAIKEATKPFIEWLKANDEYETASEGEIEDEPTGKEPSQPNGEDVAAKEATDIDDI